MRALGLVIQQMAFGVGQGESGSGVLQLVSSKTGMPQITGRYLRQSQGRDALRSGADSLYITRDTRGPSLEEMVPDCFAQLVAHASLMRTHLREEMQVEFAIENGQLHILDGVRVARSSRATVRIAVQLARDGIIPRQEALMRVEPRALNELLHRQIDRHAKRDLLGSGIAASPGAATGQAGVFRQRSPSQCCAQRRLHPRAPRNLARGYSRHACRQGGDHRTWRHHQPRRSDRAGHRLALCGWR